MKFTVIVQLFLFLNIAKSTSLEDVSELESRLNILNKPPIKTFKDEDGSIIDCINIHNQPALDHPLLRNHKIQMRPSSMPEGMMTENNARFDDNDVSKTTPIYSSWECPKGTVPVKRTTKDDLIRANAALDYRTTVADVAQPDTTFPELYRAGIYTDLYEHPSQKFYGSKVQLSVYNLTNIVSPQTSSVFLYIGTNSTNSLEFGWTVNPQLYGDTRTRTYGFWTTNDGENKKGCFNTQCPGYVQVSRTSAAMGIPIYPVSVFGQQSERIGFVIFRDPKTGNWWLAYKLVTGKYEQIGYWPKELLPAMQDYANIIQIGGKIFSPANMTGKLPPMGSGIFVQNNKTKTCYATDIEFVNSNNQFYAPTKDKVRLSSYDDFVKGYTLDWFKNNQTKLGFDIMFGGPDYGRW